MVSHRRKVSRTKKGGNGRIRGDGSTGRSGSGLTIPPWGGNAAGKCGSSENSGIGGNGGDNHGSNARISSDGGTGHDDLALEGASWVQCSLLNLRCPADQMA